MNRKNLQKISEIQIPYGYTTSHPRMLPPGIQGCASGASGRALSAAGDKH